MIKLALLRDLNRERSKVEVVAVIMGTLYRLKTSLITSSLVMTYLTEAGSVRDLDSSNNSIESIDRRSLTYNSY